MPSFQSSQRNGVDSKEYRTMRLAVLLLVEFINTVSYATGSNEAPISRIAFGSCSNQNAPQTFWNAVIDYDPQVFIWLGDNIYGDHKRPFRLFGKERTIGPWKNVPRFYPASEQEMQLSYNKAKLNPGYSYIRKHSKVIGTWDDHDYGLNDAGKEFDGKVANQRLLLDFLDEPIDSPRRKQSGVYTSYTFGPVGKQIKCNLLPVKVQQVLTVGLKPGLSACDAFKLMFLHFAGLLSLCMISGLDILVKGCLSFLPVLMNVLTRKQVAPGGSESPLHAPSSSMKAASKFQRARLDLLRCQTSLEETCNGESYLRCFTNNSKDIGELADYIIHTNYFNRMHNL